MIRYAIFHDDGETTVMHADNVEYVEVEEADQDRFWIMVEDGLDAAEIREALAEPA